MCKGFKKAINKKQKWSVKNKKSFFLWIDFNDKKRKNLNIGNGDSYYDDSTAGRTFRISIWRAILHKGPQTILWLSQSSLNSTHEILFSWK